MIRKVSETTFSKKKQFFFFGKSLIVPKKEISGRTTTFSQDEINYASGRAPFDQMNVSEKGTEPKIA